MKLSKNAVAYNKNAENRWKNGKLKNCGNIYRLVSQNGKMFEKK